MNGEITMPHWSIRSYHPCFIERAIGSTYLWLPGSYRALVAARISCSYVTVPLVVWLYHRLDSGAIRCIVILEELHKFK